MNENVIIDENYDFTIEIANKIEENVRIMKYYKEKGKYKLEKYGAEFEIYNITNHIQKINKTSYKTKYGKIKLELNKGTYRIIQTKGKVESNFIVKTEFKIDKEDDYYIIRLYSDKEATIERVELGKLKRPSTNIFEKYIIYREYNKTLNLDPDTNSVLLQEIYNKKYNGNEEDYLKNCINTDRKIKNINTVVYSDTMTSAQTLLNKFYEALCTEDNQLAEEWELYKGQNENINFFNETAMKKMFDSIEKYPNFKKYFLNDNLAVAQFLKYYHTIGNYIPAPKYFNRSRSGGGNYDRWNLTLTKIDEYYKVKESKNIDAQNRILMELLHSKNNDKCNYLKNWLDSFGTWKVFIRENYLHNYVNIKEKDWPIIDEFNIFNNLKNPWLNKDTKKPLTVADYNYYFKLITEKIKARGKKILSGEK